MADKKKVLKKKVVAKKSVPEKTGLEEEAAPLNHRGYVGVAKFDDDLEMYCGEVKGNHVITFCAKHKRDIPMEFRKSVETYLNFCEQEGLEPELTGVCKNAVEDIVFAELAIKPLSTAGLRRIAANNIARAIGKSGLLKD